jgi:peroxiredoxin
MSLAAAQLAHGQEASGALRLGEAAPDFGLSNIEKKRIQLKDYRGKKNVALVFYPALFRAGG